MFICQSVCDQCVTVNVWTLTGSVGLSRIKSVLRRQHMYTFFTFNSLCDALITRTATEHVGVFVAYLGTLGN